MFKKISHEIFKKDPDEKRVLKQVKYKKKFESAGIKKLDGSLTKSKLIVYMNKSNVENFKSTHSFTCYKNEVFSIINSLKSNGYNIKKVYYNNKRVKYV